LLVHRALPKQSSAWLVLYCLLHTARRIKTDALMVNDEEEIIGVNPIFNISGNILFKRRAI
jgi:hypothetical protein